MQDQPATNGTVVRVVAVDRFTIPRITFASWGDTGQRVDVVYAFKNAFLPGVTEIVDAFEPFLGTRTKRGQSLLRKSDATGRPVRR